jgi:hypothetical protein
VAVEVQVELLHISLMALSKQHKLLMDSMDRISLMEAVVVIM